MDSEGEGHTSPHTTSMSSKGEYTTLGVAVDLDTQTGLKSPPAKRAKRSEPPDADLPSPSKEWVTEDEDGGDGKDGSSEEGTQSLDSFILDIFHAEGSEEHLNGNCRCPWH